MNIKYFIPQALQLSHRSILGMIRQPQAWAPTLFFPLLLAAVYAAQFSKAVNLPEFPYPNVTFLDFILPACVIQGVSALALVFITSFLSMGVGSFLIAIALRTGSQEVVNSLFPIIFVFIFISSAFFPVELMDGWYGQIAEWNPLTWIIDWTRAITIEGFSWKAFLQASGIISLISLAGIATSIHQLKRRLAVAS